MTTFDSTAPVLAGSPTRAVTRGRLVRRPVPVWWRDLTGAAFWAIVLGVVALWVVQGGLQQLGSIDGFMMATGRLTGLVSSALLLVQVFLMARVPLIEQAWGQDQLARVHRLVGFTSFNLLLAHLVLITIGYAMESHVNVIAMTVDFVLNYPGMLLAVAGTLALIMVVITSIKKARAKLRYESWHLLHLYAYLGAGLALPHQLWTGTDFKASTVATVFWWTLYAVAVLAVLIWRVALPLWRSLRAPIRVVDVRQDGPTMTTVTVGGRGVAALKPRSGQFFQWRFVDGPGWTRGNPYSLSAAPDGRTLRFTAEHLGDGSERLADLTVGTRVLLEGPYGRLHEGVRTRRKALLMASGIGITPLRALAEDMLGDPGDITIIHRVRHAAEAPLAHELRALAASRGFRYIVVEGRRLRGRPSWLPSQAAHLTDAQGLREIVPDIADHDAWLCGSAGWMDAARDALVECGIPAKNVHVEDFAY